jgi:multidrug resistance efflux pump
MTNRVDAPENVRRNLGITFAKVESRPVAQTIRVPGQFELQPEARREYRTMLAGRVELLVRQYQRVETGASLYRLTSPEWRGLQEKLTESESTIRQAEARVESIPILISAHRRHEEILEKNIALWEKRVEQLQESNASGVVSANEFASAQNMLSTQRAELAEILEKEAELKAQIIAAHAEHDAAHAQFRLLIAAASTVLGMDEKALAAPYNLDGHLPTDLHEHDEEPKTRPAAAWRKIDDVAVSASAPGIVDRLGLTNGAWASTGSLVVSVADPTQMRFRAMGMQSDLGRLKSGLPARIVPPKGGTIDLQDTMDATLTLGLSADAQERTVELIAVPARLASWARPGVSAHLEVITAGGQSELAIPLSSVIQDGLSKLIFRRDPRTRTR